MKQTLAMISIIAALIFGSIGALLAADFDAGLAALQKVMPKPNLIWG